MRRSWVQVPFPAGLKKSVFTGFFVVLRTCFFDKSRLNYFTKLFKYRTAGIREYWIVDPIKNLILVYNFDTSDSEQYTFADTIKAGIYEDLYIDFSKINL